MIPRKHGGTDDPDNLQALCWLCNTNNGDLDGILYVFDKEHNGAL